MTTRIKLLLSAGLLVFAGVVGCDDEESKSGTNPTADVGANNGSDAGGTDAGGDSGTDTNNGGEADAGTDAGTSPLPATLTTADLVGTWAGGCEAYPNGQGGTNYLDRQFTLTEAVWTIFGTIYADEDCKTALGAFRVSGPYELGNGSATVEGATEGNFRYASNEWVAYNEGFASVLTTSNCGSQPWVPFVKQSVLESGCLDAHPAAECANGEMDLVKIAEGMLHFGERSVDLCQERAPRINTYGLKPMARDLELPVEGLYPEGIALDRYLPAYVSSIGTGKVLRHDGTSSSAIYDTAYGLGGATVGMKVDGDNLWTCVADTSTYATSVVKLNRQTGEVLATYAFPAPGFCNDLIVDADGAVYATESTQGIVYKLAPGATEWTSWLSGYPADPAAGFGFNGLAITPDGGHLLIGRIDTGELLEVEIKADGSAGDVTVTTPGGAPSAIGFDGLLTWRGAVYAVRDGAVVRMDKREGAWELTTLLAGGELNFPTTLSVDNHGNVFVVEGKLGLLLDGDDTTNAEGPFRIRRISPMTE